MNRSPEGTKSVWMQTARRPRLPVLDRDAAADVCVIGAGMTGLTTAYLLGREGRSVIVIDDGPIGSGQTERTTAHLSNVLDDRYFWLEELHGEAGARTAAESHSAAIDRIQWIVRHERITCDFQRVDGYLFVPPGESPDILSRELLAARRAGLTDVELLARTPIDTFEFGPCLHFPRQAQFHILKYLHGLARAIRRNGGRIFGNTHAAHVVGGSPARISTDRGPAIAAGAVVVATNSPINDRVAIHSKQAAYQTYAIAARVPAGRIPTALLWDTGDADHTHPAPYHYVRLQAVSPQRSAGTGRRRDRYELLIVGGEDHKTGQATDARARYQRLEQWAHERFPIESIEARWSGQVLEPVDGLAFIGPNPMDRPNVFIATGDSGNGLTHGTIAGILLTDLILERDNPWRDIYAPSRKSLGAVLEYARENLNVAGQYVDWLAPGQVRSSDEVPAGSGAIIRNGLSKRAVYRDRAGALHELSAVCPHLGCVVAWNESEQSWDCPCHGSRFDATGRVLQGPANRDLAVQATQLQHT